jgi:hypothetical protein
MLADPQTVTIGGSTYTLPRTGTGENTATYTKDDGTVSLRVSHRKSNGGREKRVQTLIRLDTTDIAADPLQAGINREATVKVWLVIDRPTVGVSLTSAVDKAKGLLGALSATSYALLTKITGGES